MTRGQMRQATRPARAAHPAAAEGREECDAFLRSTAALRLETGAAQLGARLHPQILYRDGQGLGDGPGAVLEDLRQQAMTLPDRTCQTEDLLISGSARLGWLGAQRLVVTGHHRGAGLWGAPTGRALRFREMRETYAKAGRITDIWSVRDTGAICAQIGVDPQTVARRIAGAPLGGSAPFRPEQDVPGAYTGDGNDSQWGLGYADLLSRAMQGEGGVFEAQYDPACQLDLPGGATDHGADAAARFWSGLRAAIPTGQFKIHHRIGEDGPLMPPRAALRWSLRGTHAGWGLFGAPSGADLFVMGFAQAEFGAQGLRREWVLFDTLAIWRQIVAHQGA
ncbi:MAG: ester cyclase [Pelagimonas sp.]|nr:ester cyclase [Pelagimonas sp.]